MRFVFTFLLLPFMLFAQDHLLLSEVLVPSSSEAGTAFIEIYNPTDQSLSLNNVHLSNYDTYYKMVNADYSNNTAKFLVKFTDIEIAPKANLVIALDGSAFTGKFTSSADYEIAGTDDNTADMVVLYAGSNIKLESSNGFLILFQWDGSSDLIQDIDYISWGFFTTGLMDKSGVSIDGPDANNDASNYLDDLSAASQKKATIPTGGQSLQRNGIVEIDEVTTGGNGLNGHNEATENWRTSFVASAPSPGSFSEVEGDGAGIATIFPSDTTASAEIDLTITITGESTYTLTDVQIIVPGDWSWGQSLSDVVLSGDATTGSGISVSGDTITLSSTSFTASKSGSVKIENITTPDITTTSTFTVRSAVSGGNLTTIANSPQVSIIAPISIADLQNNFDDFNGQQVTLDAVVAIGAGITRSDHTDAYVQDESGRGINVFRSNEIVSDLAVGNKVRITATVSEFSGTTQLSDFTVSVLSTGNEIPAVARMSVAQASDISLEGTFVETAGVIEDLAMGIGGGANLTINDGTGSITARIWDNTGVDLSGYSTGDTVAIRAVIDIFNSEAQLLLAYDKDIFPGSIKTRVDGSGTVSVDPFSVALNSSATLTFSFIATAEDTVDKVSILVPSEWQWNGTVNDVGTFGAFSDASVEVSGKLITLSNTVLSPNETGDLEINNLTAPAVDTISTFKVQTAGLLGSLSSIARQPIVRVGKGTQIDAMTIAEIRANKGLYLNQPITIQGTIVIGAGILRTDFTSAYIVDSTGAGLNVFRFGEIDPDIVRGNLVILRGTLTEFNGVLEIESYQTTVLATGATLPEPIILNTNDAAGLEHEGSFVAVSGVIIESFSAGGGTNLEIDDASGSVVLRIWDSSNLDLSAFTEGTNVTAQGIHSVFRETGQVLVGYQEDISVLELEDIPVSLKLPNKPFAPDQGEFLEIEYGPGSGNTHITMRIFDLGGRLVTTIFDKPGAPFVTSRFWNGRNDLGELVTIGTYILHFEVTNEDTGKKTQKIAPIVVGTILSR
jgi:hypothetical protein